MYGQLRSPEVKFWGPCKHDQLKWIQLIKIKNNNAFVKVNGRLRSSEIKVWKNCSQNIWKANIGYIIIGMWIHHTRTILFSVTVKGQQRWNFEAFVNSIILKLQLGMNILCVHLSHCVHIPYCFCEGERSLKSTNF